MDKPEMVLTMMGMDASMKARPDGIQIAGLVILGPSSLLEKEPLTAAEVNGVRFEVSDMGALLSLR